jgi:hypothetical protein
MENIPNINNVISRFLDEQVLAFFKLIAHSMHAKPISISIIMEKSNIDDKQCAYVNQLLQILRENKSPSQISHLNCQMANIQYLQHVDNQISRIHLDGYEDSDILHLIKMLASPRPDGQQRVIYLNLGEELAIKMVKSIKKVCIEEYYSLSKKKSICSGILRLHPTCATTILSQFLWAQFGYSKQ